jgi:ubiquinone/menaquinone biosynthesis C-methylase UbiE
MDFKVCPWWLSFTLNNRFRKIMHDPAKILSGYISEGHTAVDLGCGSGFFTLSMARLAGKTGRVIAVDLQQKMLDMLRKNAERAGLSERITYHRCGADNIGLKDKADFIMAFYVVHETPDEKAFLSEVKGMMKPGAKFLMAEPKFHISAARFGKTVDTARRLGMKPAGDVIISMSRAAIFTI